MAKNRCPEDRLICTNPFEWFEIHPDGQVFLCCPAWLRVSIGNLLEEPVEAVWNGEKARTLRKAILGGAFQCCKKRCPRLAAGTAPVLRLKEVAGEEVREAMGRRDALLPYGPKRLNLCFDRSCTLACPSCREDFQNARGKERERAELIARKVREEAGREAEEITLSGLGDPFGSPAYLGLLRGFSPGDFPRLKEIRLHTNGQLWDRRMWASMPQVHPLVKSAEISIDAATPETYAVNRRGGDFGRLLENLDFLKTLPIEVKLSFVVQANNHAEIPAFVEMAASRGFSVYFSQLVNWGTFAREEFRRRAVHLPGHPEHGRLQAALRQVAGTDGVDLGNLLGLVSPDRKNRVAGLFPPC